MGTKYIVDWTSHNGKTDAWNYKQAKQFDDLNTAKKEFHNILSTYIQYGDLDHVCAIIWDSYGNKIVSEYWSKPAPEPEPESEG